MIVQHPLALGAVLLFALSGIAGRASWGFPDLQGMGANLGGEDVEEYVVGDSVMPPPSENGGLIAPSVFASSEDGSSREEILGDAGGLVTVPWAPVVPSGASGRNVVTYTVAEGDTLSSIAARFGVDVRSIAWSNDIPDWDAIRPGDVLRIPPVSGVLHIVKAGETLEKIAKRFSADPQRIIAFNGLPADGALVAGDELVIPGGTPPPPPKPKVPPPSTVSSTPRFATSPVPLGYFIAPTTGRNFGRIHSHNGVDIANACGTPVYAAAEGEITRADASGWNGGYGNVIDIAHPNGTSTRYAHLSKILVVSGYVAQGQLIGLIGTTGRSTGCHLHFEVHGARNPLAR